MNVTASFQGRVHIWEPHISCTVQRVPVALFFLFLTPHHRKTISAFVEDGLFDPLFVDIKTIVDTRLV